MPRENSSLLLGLGIACFVNLAAAQEVQQPKQPDLPKEAKSTGSEKPAQKAEPNPEAAPKEPEAAPKEPSDGAAAADPARKDIPEKMPAFRYEALLSKSSCVPAICHNALFWWATNPPMRESHSCQSRILGQRLKPWWF